MLTVEVVKLRKDGVGAVALVPRHGLSLAEATALLQQVCDHVAVMATRGDLVRALMGIANDAAFADHPRGAVMAAARLIEAATDDDVSATSVVEPMIARHALWDAAVAVREGDAPFVRSDIVSSVAGALGVSSEDVERSYDGDREGARPVNLSIVDPAQLAEVWEQREVQALLFRAHSVIVRMPELPAMLRRFLRATRLQQLVVDIGGELADEVRIEGVLPSHGASTRYGKQLSSLLPACWHWPTLRLRARVQVPRRGQVEFRWSRTAVGAPNIDEADDHSFAHQLQAELIRLTKTPVVVDDAAVLLRGPHGSSSVPDVVIAGLGRPIAVEMLGPWSRSTVVARLSLSVHMEVDLFLCVPQRLRIAEAIADDTPAGVWVHRGEVRAKALAAAIVEWLPQRVNR
jgi:predicted nuclease of restriction endonuclease-like RecB superfamily